MRVLCLRVRFSAIKIFMIVVTTMGCTAVAQMATETGTVCRARHWNEEQRFWEDEWAVHVCCKRPRGGEEKIEAVAVMVVAVLLVVVAAVASSTAAVGGARLAEICR